MPKFETCSTPMCHNTGKFGNVHGEQFGQTRCDKCHGLQDFKKSSFKHEDPKYNGYKLIGKHATTACAKCHRPNAVTKVALYKPIRTATCEAVGCHDVKERGYIHGNQFKGLRCESCHDEKGWKPAKFSHTGPKFIGYKLSGKHEKAACEKCHRRDPVTKIALYKPIRTASCDAAGCHDVKERGYVHGDQFKGQKCSLCHTTKDWKYEKKLHDYTQFKLVRWHVKLKCDACHKTKGVWNDQKRACAPCHYDPHLGKFAGGDSGCEPCHGFFRINKQRYKTEFQDLSKFKRDKDK
ncbi:MAG: hypothetical protein HY280_01370 [Nitrospinae bacterium]|nr:hypothetical protein [Nitrospinota bacterium]